MVHGKRREQRELLHKHCSKTLCLGRDAQHPQRLVLFNIIPSCGHATISRLPCLQERMISLWLSTEIHLLKGLPAGFSGSLKFLCSRFAVKQPCFSDTLIERGEKIGDLGLEKPEESCDSKYFHFQQVCTFKNICPSLL